MNRELRFAVNDREIRTDKPEGMAVLDFIREELGLKGTKEGCREGDCGACAVLLGERLPEGGVRYFATPSCLLSLGKVEGRHIVTIEGLAAGAKAKGLEGGLSPVMKILLEENGSQCGFCSPGVVIALTSFLLGGPPYDEAGAIVAVEGNLCRCTGYAAIRRAAAKLAREFGGLPADFNERLALLIEKGAVPESLGAYSSGTFCPQAVCGTGSAEAAGSAVVIGGGTDYYVRNPEPDPGLSFLFLNNDPEYCGVKAGPEGLEVGAATRLHDFFADGRLRSFIPGIERFEDDIASSLVRSEATIGGNAVNGSPIADMMVMLIALGAQVKIRDLKSGRERSMTLDRLYLGYKKLDLAPGEVLASFIIPKAEGAGEGRRFNFEKVAKRQYLDIASANTAACFEVEGPAAKPRIVSARLSAGGVAPVPLYLKAASEYLRGKEASAETAKEAARLAVAASSPIDDVRGSADYRRRLLSRLILAHFVRLFPETGIAEVLFP